MRISDWSSDVCSSDLLLVAANGNLPSGVASIKPLTMFAPMPIGLALLAVGLLYFRWVGRRWLGSRDDPTVTPARTESYFARTYGIEIGRASCRERVCQYV